MPQWTGTGCPAGGGSGAGQAAFTYDLLGRLTQWTSPFPPTTGEAGSIQARQTYTLDDAGNVVAETNDTGPNTVDRLARLPEVGEVAVPLPGATLTSLVDTAGPGGAGASAQVVTATFDAVGLETTREVVDLGSDDPGDETTLSTTTQTPGPGGYVATTAIDDDGDGSTDTTVGYLYDPASERLLRRTTTDGSGTDTRVYFRFTSGMLAEEADAAGTWQRSWMP